MVKDKILAGILLFAVALSIVAGYAITDWNLWLKSEQLVMCLIVSILPMVTMRYKYLFVTSVFAFAMCVSHFVHTVINAPYSVIVGHSIIGFLSIIIGILVQKFTTNKRTTK